MIKFSRLVFVLLGSLICTAAMAETKVVVLGTGTPVPDAHRAGPGVAVIYNNKAYLFDIGAGVVRNAIKADQLMGIKALNPTKIEHVFLTHTHSDHVNDFSELAQTVWWRKDVKITLYGPEAIDEIIEGMYQMTGPDTHFRLKSIQPKRREDAWQVKSHVIEGEGIVFKDDGISIEAFVVPHGEFKPAFGYKIVTTDKTIVISGDTAYSEKLIEKAKGADILLHEVISKAGLSRLSKMWQEYHTAYHTPTDKVAEVANKTKPGLLVLYHGLFYGAPEASVIDEIKQDYSGNAVLADDLDVF